MNEQNSAKAWFDPFDILKCVRGCVGKDAAQALACCIETSVTIGVEPPFNGTAQCNYEHCTCLLGAGKFGIFACDCKLKMCLVDAIDQQE
jgi:hypothetical protein